MREKENIWLLTALCWIVEFLVCVFTGEGVRGFEISKINRAPLMKIIDFLKS